MTTRTATPPVSRAARLARGAVAMVLFVVPVLLLGLAVRQRFDPLVRLDNDLIRRATGFTREHGTADTLIGLQAASQPFLIYVLATAVALWAWLGKGLRGRPLGVRDDDGRVQRGPPGQGPRRPGPPRRRRPDLALPGLLVPVVPPPVPLRGPLRGPSAEERLTPVLVGPESGRAGEDR
jgi:hypothetical protein